MTTTRRPEERLDAGSRLLPMVLAVFTITSILLLAWGHQRSRVMLDQMVTPMDQLAQTRAAVLDAEIVAERWLVGDTNARPEQAVARLDAALSTARDLELGRSAWLDLGQGPGMQEPLRARAVDYRAAIGEMRTLIRRRMDSPTALSSVVDLRQARGHLDEAAMAVETALAQQLEASRRQQNWIDIGIITVVALGAMLMYAWLAVYERRRQSAVAALADSESRARAFAEAMPEVAFLLDEDGRYEEAFATAPEMLARPRSEIIGSRLIDHFSQSEVDTFLAVIRRALDEGRTIAHEYSLRMSGKTYAFEARVSPVQGARKVVWVSWDITQRRRSEQRVRDLTRLYSFISQVNQAIVWERDATRMLQRICDVARAHGMFSTAWVGMIESDPAGLRVVAASGEPAASALGTVLEPPPDHPASRALASASLQRSGGVGVMPGRDGGGSAVPASVAAVPLRSKGQVVGVLVLGAANLDIEHAEEAAVFDEVGADLSFALTQIALSAEREAYEERVRLHAAALESTQDGVIVMDRQQCIVSINRAFTNITGIAAEDAIGRTPADLRLGHDDGGLPEEVWASVLEHGAWQGEILGRRRNGEHSTQWASISTVPDDSGAPTHVVAVFTDISHLKRTEERLDRRAHFDPLTHLPNRLMLLSRLEQAITAAQRRGCLVGLLFIDLDNFKTVNDSLGHAAGDALLERVAGRLRSRVRRDDTLGRLGGDEFLLVLERLDDARSAGQVAQDLLATLDAPFAMDDGRELYVQASIGISVYPNDGAHAGDLVRDADAAMYQAKKAGRNTYRYYTGELTDAANERLAMETRLRRALEQGAFELWYQPLVRLTDQGLLGLEALVRMRDDGGQVLGPNVFIPAMEESGLIVALGEWVQREACRQGAEWLRQGWDFGRIAINMSSVEIARGGVEERLARILDETGFPPGRLEVEITESSLMIEGDRADTLLAHLRRLGITVSLDDFGTGYSSLAYLKRFPVNKLKIDRSFVKDIPADAQDMQLTATIIGMGLGLGLTVLAEGVETAEQMAFLQSWGCHAAQGYLFSKPLPADEIRRRYDRGAGSGVVGEAAPTAAASVSTQR